MSSPASGRPTDTASRTVSWKRNFYVLWIAEVVAILGFSCVQPFLAFYVQRFVGADLARAAVWSGWLGAAGGMGMAVFSPIWGAVADRVGRKPMVARAMIGGGLAVILMAFTQSASQLLFIRFLQGALSGTVTACIALVSTTAPRRQLGYALGMMQMSVMLGNSVGPLFGGVLIDRVGYDPTFILSGTVVVIAGICVSALVVEDFHRPAIQTGDRGGGWLTDGLRPFIRNKPFLLMVLTLTLIQFTFSVAMPIFPLFIQQLAHTEKVASTAGVIFALAGVTGALSSAVLGRLSDRLGYRRTLVAGILLSGVLYLGHGLVRSITELTLLRILLGLASGAISPVANAMIAGFVDERHRGKAFGISTSASAVSWAVGPVVGGHLGASWGFRSVFVFTALLVLGAGIWIMSVIKEPGETYPAEGSRGEDTEVLGSSSR